MNNDLADLDSPTYYRGAFDGFLLHQLVKKLTFMTV